MSFALTFNPIVTASNIEIDKKILGDKLPNTILKNMEQLFEKHKTQGSISPSRTISSIPPKVKTQVK